MPSISEGEAESMAGGSTTRLSDRIYLHIYDYETKEFSGLTTYHGLVRIYNSNTWPSRIFWCVVVLSCLSLFMIHSGYLLLGYHSKPTLFQVNTLVPESGMEFPDITICNYNPIMKHKLERWNMSTELASYLLESYSEYVDLDAGKLNTMEETFKGYKGQFNKSNAEGFELLKFFASVAPACEEVLISCAFAGIVQENCCDGATTVTTDIGQCIRLPASSGRRQWFSGSSYGWRFVVDSRKDIDTNLLPSVMSAQGVRVILSEPGKAIPLRSRAVSAPPGTAIYAGIDTKNISLLRRGDWGVCQQSWDPLLHAEVLLPVNYSASHCEWNCQLKDYLYNCGCVPISVPFDLEYEVCSPAQLKKCHQKLEVTSIPECKCDVECDNMDYSMQTSYADLTRRKLGPTVNLTEEYIQDSVTLVQLYFRRISYERHEQQKQLQTADLLSNIAGSMGLFLGMSTVTLLEIFIYLFKSVWGTVNTERQNQFMQAMMEEEEERRQSLVIVEQPTTEAEEQEQPDSLATRRASRRISVVPVHIHLDRRGSRMVAGRRDSTIVESILPNRRSISVAPQMFNAGHRQSLAVGSLGHRSSLLDTSGEILPGRRGSAAVPNNRHRMSFALPSQSNRRLSIQPADDAIHLSFVNPATRRKSSVRPMDFLL